MPVRKPSSFTVDEYLKNEEIASVRHEFVNGYVYAMTGATGRHRIITDNIHAAFRAYLKGSSCRADSSNAQVYVEANNSFYYPDVVVSCGDVDYESMSVANPILIVEVLSRSTAAIDKREKLFAYEKIPTLSEYLIVHQRTKRAELHRKNDEEIWETLEYRDEDIELISMPCGPFKLLMDVIYEDVKWNSIDGLQVQDEVANYHPVAEEFDW